MKTKQIITILFIVINQIVLAISISGSVYCDSSDVAVINAQIIIKYSRGKTDTTYSDSLGGYSINITNSPLTIQASSNEKYQNELGTWIYKYHNSIPTYNINRLEIDTNINFHLKIIPLDRKPPQIQFNFNEAKLIVDAKWRLEEIIDILNKNPAIEAIEIRGFTNIDEHKNLGVERAKVVQEYISKKLTASTEILISTEHENERYSLGVHNCEGNNITAEWGNYRNQRIELKVLRIKNYE